MPMLIASLICWRIRRLVRLSRGSAIIRGAKVICRDRDGVYASAARRGAPDALQVADRWHLVHNLADALERFAVRVLAVVRRELKAEETRSEERRVGKEGKAGGSARP